MDKLNIFLTDDDEDDRDLFEEALKRIERPTALSTFQDCKGLVSVLLRTPEPMPDIIFLDINMPEKNGLICLKDIKKDPRFAHIPIIMFTTSSRLIDIQEARKSGANLFLNKPSDFNELVALLNNLFSESGMKKIKGSLENT